MHRKKVRDTEETNLRNDRILQGLVLGAGLTLAHGAATTVAAAEIPSCIARFRTRPSRI